MFNLVIHLFFVLTSFFVFLFYSKKLAVNIVQENLLLYLKNTAKRLKIPVCYCSRNSIGEENSGKLRMICKNDRRSFIIFISDDKLNDPYVLGHELGHYFAEINDNDCSEFGANYYLFRLISKFLTSFERYIIQDNIYVILEEARL